MPQAASEAPFGQVVRQMGKLMDQLRGFYSFAPNETWVPSVNLYENDTAYVVCVDLAGVDKDKIDLSIVDSTLRLRGARPVPALPGPSDNQAVACPQCGEPIKPPAEPAPEAPTEETKQGRWRVHLMEIDNGAFYREVTLPKNTVPESIRARYINGILWIEIPKK